jgi:hypothetical protein
MSMQASTVGLVLLGAMLTGSVSLAPARFTAISTDAVAPNLRVVTVLDAGQNSCYLLFVSEPSRPVAHRSDTAGSDLNHATTSRDRQLAALADAHERSFKSEYPGTTPISPLRFEWEGWKILSEYERVIRQNELAQLRDEFAGMAASAISVSGPAPCGARHRTSSSTENPR